MTQEQQYIAIIEMVKPILNKLGSIRTGDAWEICKEKFSYDHVRVHFKKIMEQVVIHEQRADFVKPGHWFIFRQIKKK